MKSIALRRNKDRQDEGERQLMRNGNLCKLLEVHIYAFAVGSTEIL